MKTRCWLLSAFLLLASLGSADVIAQGGCPPTPDCHSDPWIGLTSTTYFLPGNNGPCTVTVWFCYRVACGMYFDMYITGVVMSIECNGLYTNDQILDGAIDAVWQANPWGATISNCPQGTPVWRVFSAGCYAAVPPGGCSQGPPPDPTTVTLESCEESSQCFALYNICRMVTGGIKKTLVMSSPAGECSGSIADCPCTPWCPE